MLKICANQNFRIGDKKVNKVKNNTLTSYLQNLFSYTPKEEYNFTIPETQEEKSKLNTFQEPYQSENNDIDKLQPKNIFTNIGVNLEAITTRYNTMINSDIIIRDFSITVKNKEYKAFLLYIDGMVDTKSINHFVLDPLMLRNMANTYQNQENEIVKEAVSNNIVIRKVKKFDLASYIYNHLVPQNSVKQINTFDDVASRSKFW